MSEKVKSKVIELLYSWTLALPEEAKIKDAYHMLKRQGTCAPGHSHNSWARQGRKGSLGSSSCREETCPAGEQPAACRPLHVFIPGLWAVGCAEGDKTG